MPKVEAPVCDWAAVDAQFLDFDATEVILPDGGLTASDDRSGAARQWEVSVLTRTQWNRLTPFVLSTARLHLRPVAEAEMDAFAAMIDDADIARMLVNLPHPIDPAAARQWWHKRRFTGRLGFQLGIFNAQGQPVGSAGISALSNALVYFFAREARGHGYAREFVGPLCGHVLDRWRIDSIFAGVFTDNPASRHVLERASFVVTGEGISASPGRAEPAPFWEMALRR